MREGVGRREWRTEQAGGGDQSEGFLSRLILLGHGFLRVFREKIRYASGDRRLSESVFTSYLRVIAEGYFPLSSVPASSGTRSFVRDIPLAHILQRKESYAYSDGACTG